QSVSVRFGRSRNSLNVLEMSLTISATNISFICSVRNGGLDSRKRYQWGVTTPRPHQYRYYTQRGALLHSSRIREESFLAFNGIEQSAVLPLIPCARRPRHSTARNPPPAPPPTPASATAPRP